MKNLPLTELAQYLQISLDSTLHLSGYQIDSRLIQPGNLFFALKGERVDGHNFLAQVAEQGGVAAVVSNTYAGESYGLVLLPVPDVLRALQMLAQWSVQRDPVPMIGITGSMGKTTTKEFLVTLMEGSMRVGRSPASYNSQVTFPLNLLNRSGQEEVLILEMGMSAPGELSHLVQIAPPQIGVLTQVALAHAQYFPEGLSGIARAKAELFSHPATRCAVLDAQILALYPDLPFPEERIVCSLQDPTADLFLTCAEGSYMLDERGVRVARLEFPFREKHFIQNALLAMGAARRIGLSWEEIQRRLPLLRAPNMRFERCEQGGVVFINDAYNANPTSMCVALEQLPAPREGGKKIAVLASMRELGAFSESAHREVGLFAQKQIDLLLVLGEEARPLYQAFVESKKPAEFFSDRESLTERLAQLLRPGDVVLLKGARAMQLEKIMEHLHVAASV
jgi:UDP-N-acetylmuramoyl-tripeptide--D-alanyl-D-alanine ligase